METKVKSLRLTPETIALIESWSGVSFTDKFVNLVNDAYLSQERHQQRIHELERQRDRLLREINDLQAVKGRLRQLAGSASRTYELMLSMESTVKQMTECVGRISSGGEP